MLYTLFYYHQNFTGFVILTNFGLTFFSMNGTQTNSTMIAVGFPILVAQDLDKYDMS